MDERGRNALREHAIRVQRRAEELEPAIRALAEDLVALSSAVRRSTSDESDATARRLWAWTGWNAATDATDLISGHLVSATASWPTERRYADLCQRFDTPPVKLWGEVAL